KNRTVVIGTESTASPAAAGKVTRFTNRSANPRLVRSPARSCCCAWVARLGSAAVLSAVAKIARGNSKRWLAYHKADTLPAARKEANNVLTTRVSWYTAAPNNGGSRRKATRGTPGGRGCHGGAKGTPKRARGGSCHRN